jgi:non-specific serine/threonine protein kinase
VTPDAGAYIVMELLEGHSLREQLSSTGRFEAEAAVALMAQVCTAVGAAHRGGVVHRDLKPENIFLDRRDGEVVVKVVDFGLAKLEAALHSTDDALTHEGAVLGTPVYMSPEQCRGEEADARSDVYALGCVTYELLTGEPPFKGRGAWALVYKHVNEAPRRPSEVATGIPAEIEEAVMWALAKKPEDRPPTVEAFAEALGAPAVFGATPASGGTPVRATDTAPDGAAPAGKAPANNLPHAATNFVGRERQIDEVLGWLTRARLVTLAGPGGIGKTRLALEAAARAAGEYADGVWLVELASLSDPDSVARAVASALGVRDHAGRPEVEALEAWIRDRRTLLVLDNCEHLVGACAGLVSRLLAASAGLRVLATSRESLAVAGEAVWQVPTLAVAARAPEGVLGIEAVRLFADRASLAKPGFEVTEATAPRVAELCRRLEGIPLAIELAAARVRALTVDQILERLGDRFKLLAYGSRGAPTRQQTLRATLDWSYDLLTEAERALFRRLSAFVGGWTLEAAEAVGSGSPDDDVLDLLIRLVDKSLVAAQGQSSEERFRMLEVVREYASERLRESGEKVEVARRHADVFRAMTRAMSERFVGPEEAGWLARLEAEHDNLRAALGWLLENDPERCLATAVDLQGFWSLHGHFAEGAQWMTAALGATDPAAPLRIIALRGAGELEWRRGDLAAARALLEESMRMAREAGGARDVGWSAFHLALVIQQQGDARGSCAYLEESLERGREVADDRLVGNALNSLGEAARMEGDWAGAIPFYERSLEAHRKMGHPVGISLTLCNLGAAHCDAGDPEAARRCYREALPSLRELGNAMGVSLALDGLAAVASKRGEWERAARLAGAAAALRDEIGGELEPADRLLRERCLDAVRGQLGDAALEAAVAEGRAMGLEQAVRDSSSV